MSSAHESWFTSPQSSLWTSLRYFSISRVVIALCMSLLVPLGIPNLELLWPELFMSTALAYLGLSLVFALIAQRDWPGFFPQMVVQIGSDILLLGLLVHMAGGQRNGFVLLLIVPVAAAAVLSTRRMALFFAALASLVALIDVGISQGEGRAEVNFMPAGLLGGCLFAIAWVINTMAQRISVKEAEIQKAAQALRNQQAVNQLVIEEMTYGVVVLDADANPRYLNRAALVLLAKEIDDTLAQLLENPAWQQIIACYKQWQRQGPNRNESVETVLNLPSTDAAQGLARRRVRLRFLAAPEAGDTLMVVEDTDHLEQRAQQLKLASMGRLSASIAHEIRNPLGAIRHANSLLQETLVRSAEPTVMAQRFTDIVEKNSLRINRIIEDVLGLARRGKIVSDPIDVGPFLSVFLDEFFSDHEEFAGEMHRQRVRVQLNSTGQFYFDENHLRQVFVNLLNNALRYASDAPGAIVISLIERGGLVDAKLELRVSDDGPGLAQEVAAHVFEPFHSTEAKGTGLGLFLVQELCAINQASIHYESPPLARSTGFVIRPKAVQVMSGQTRTEIASAVSALQ